MKKPSALNWSLVIKLSMFGLVMGVATAYFLPSSIEPYIWALVLALSAYLLAKNLSRKLFLNGLATGILNALWVAAAHILLLKTYMETHPKEAALMNASKVDPRFTMLVAGAIMGIISGAIMGILAAVITKLLRRRAKS